MNPFRSVTAAGAKIRAWAAMAPRARFIRPEGEDLVMGRILLDRNRKKDEPRFIKTGRDQMIGGLIQTYEKAAARTQ